MKLNNKGFAITAVLYGLLILFVVLVSSYLVVLSAKKDRVEDLTTNIENEYQNYEQDHTINNNLKEHIISLYNDNYDSSLDLSISSDEIRDSEGSSYGLYYFAPDVHLMNVIENVDGATSSSDEGNIRYYGNDDSNLKNYIYFNCSDYSNQTDSTCEKWRIVGIVDDKVKIIKNTSIGNYDLYYNYHPDDWDVTISFKDLPIVDLLNQTYYNRANGTYYDGELDPYSESGLYITSQISASFNEIGITDATKNNNIISLSNWSYPTSYFFDYGGTAYDINYDLSGYFSGNIALLNLAEYIYACDMHYNEHFYSSDELCDNWIKNIINSAAWLLSDCSSSHSGGTNCGVLSKLYGFEQTYGSADNLEIIPTLYLNPELGVETSTDGSETNPYKIIIN